MKTKLAFVFIAFLAACSSESPVPITDLSGKWTVSSTTVNGKINLTRQPGTDLVYYKVSVDNSSSMKISYDVDRFVNEGSATQKDFATISLISGTFGFFTFSNGVVSKDLKTIEFDRYMAPKSVEVVEKVVFTRL